MTQTGQTTDTAALLTSDPSPAAGADLRIVGGETAAPGEYPWQAMLLASNGRYFCGGSLIHPQWVVTAAHCVEKGTVARLVLGAHSRTATAEDSRQSFALQRVIIHPNYKSGRFDNDIALIELAEPALLNQHVATVGVMINGLDDALMAEGVWATVTGWGMLAESGFLATELQELTIPLVSHETCQAAYSGLITLNMVCAGLVNGGKDACYGDSGGPLVVPDGVGGWRLAGIVSWGIGCARPDLYGVYTRVANYFDWIKQEIGDDLPTNPATVSKDINVVRNSDFELGDNAEWQTQSKNKRQVITNEAPIIALSGDNTAWLGGTDRELATLSQPITLPSASAIYLVFRFQRRSDDANCFRDYAVATINRRAVKIFRMCSTKQSTEWGEVSLNLSQYAGQAIEIGFRARTDGDAPSSFIVDDVVLQSAPGARSYAALPNDDDLDADGEINDAYLLEDDWFLLTNAGEIEEDNSQVEEQPTAESAARQVFLPLIVQ